MCNVTEVMDEIHKHGYRVDLGRDSQGWTATIWVCRDDAEVGVTWTHATDAHAALTVALKRARSPVVLYDAWHWRNKTFIGKRLSGLRILDTFGVR